MTTSFYDAFKFLEEHPIFTDYTNPFFTSHFIECLDISVVKVNPSTNAIDDNKSLNTKTMIWLECGPYKKDCRCHDVDLDVDGESFEEAIANLAVAVHEKYGETKEFALAKVASQYN